MAKYTRDSLNVKITKDTKFEVLEFYGEHLNGTPWRYWSIQIDGRYWSAGNEGEKLIIVDNEEYASHFSSEENANEYVDFIKKFFIEV